MKRCTSHFIALCEDWQPTIAPGCYLQLGVSAAAFVAVIFCRTRAAKLADILVAAPTWRIFKTLVMTMRKGSVTACFSC